MEPSLDWSLICYVGAASRDGCTCR